MFAASQAFTQGNQGFSSSGGGASGGSGKKPRQEDKQSALPVTVRAVENALSERGDSGGDLQFYGRDQGMLILVAAVESVSKQSSSVELSLNDATGRLKARHYVTDATSQQVVDELTVGRYVSAFGSVRLAPEVHFAITGLRLVNSADEVSFHTIEVAHAALKLRSGSAVDEPKTPMKAMAPSAEVKAEPVKMDVSPPKELPPQPVLAAAPPVLPTKALHGPELRRALLEFLRTEGDGKAQGVSLARAAKFAEPATTEEVKGALAKFVDDGDVYNTIDEAHFQVV